MGKGGTKFDGDAVGVRTKKGPAALTSKDRRKNMETFLATGQHPELEKARKERDSQLLPLPILNIARPFVFLELTIAKEPAGRLVIELFDDIVPVAANHFRNRCLPGSAAGVTGATVHKLIPYHALFGARNPKASEGLRLQPNLQLRHVEAGAVSISLNGDEFAIALARATKLDESHQVVGRVLLGLNVLEAMNDVRTSPTDDAPFQRVTISRAGPTNHKGDCEDQSLTGSGPLPPKDAAAKLREDSKSARNAVKEALEVALGQKRRAEDAADGEQHAAGEHTGSSGAAGPSTSRPGAAAPGALDGTAAHRGQRNVKAKVLDAMLGDISSSSSSGSDSGGSDVDADADEGGS